MSGLLTLPLVPGNTTTETCRICCTLGTETPKPSNTRTRHPNPPLPQHSTRSRRCVRPPRLGQGRTVRTREGNPSIERLTSALKSDPQEHSDVHSPPPPDHASKLRRCSGQTGHRASCLPTIPPPTDVSRRGAPAEVVVAGTARTIFHPCTLPAAPFAPLPGVTPNALRVASRAHRIKRSPQRMRSALSGRVASPPRPPHALPISPDVTASSAL